MTIISENLSWYQLSAPVLAPRAPLRGEDSQVDICIIGGGFTGLSTALELRAKGYSVAVLEARYVGHGASGRNGGQIACGYAPGMRATEQIVGPEDAKKLWHIAEEAKALLTGRIRDLHIDCDLSSGEMMCAVKSRHMEDLKAEAEFCHERYGYAHFEIVDKEDLAERLASRKYHGGLLDHAGGHLNPVKLIRELAKSAENSGVEIYENSNACDINLNKKIKIRTKDAALSCDHLVLAANVYMGSLSKDMSRRFLPVGTYILATEPLDKDLADSLIPENFCVNDTKNILDYYRMSPDGRMLYGGRDSAIHATGNIEQKLRTLMLDTFPQLAHAKTAHVWGGQAAVTFNRLPDIGRMGRNVYYAQGFSGQGVALTGMAGKILAQAIAQDTGKLDIFSRIPHRKLPASPLLRNAALRLAMFWYRLCDMV